MGKDTIGKGNLFYKLTTRNKGFSPARLDFSGLAWSFGATAFDYISHVAPTCARL